MGQAEPSPRRSDPPAPVLDPRRTESRAAPPASRPTLLIVGGLGVVALAVALVLKLSGPSSANVPMGIAGAKLGSDSAALMQAVPGLTDAPNADESFPRMRGKVSLLDEPATCTYELGVEGRLSRIDCALDPAPNPESARKTQAKVLGMLRKLYGPESEQHGESYKWQNGRARLLMIAGRTSDVESAAVSTIRVSNWSVEHEHALGALASQRSTREEAERDERNRGELEKRRLELERRQRERATDE